MNWKPGVVVSKEPDYALQLGGTTQPVPEKDVYLVNAIEQGIAEDPQLVRLIMEAESIDETAAAFGLAQFLIDFSNFIAPDTGHYLITD